MIRVLIFNEYLHEKDPGCKASEIYPNGIHGALAELLNSEEDIEAHTVTLDDIETGITEKILKETDVILWWGHMAHDRVPDEKARLVHEAVLNGMGAIFLHSAHKSKPFMRLMGTSCSLIWRESDDLERVWVSAPYHPIVRGLDNYFELKGEETYGEPFGIPTPDETLLIGWFTGGEVFRSGCTWQRDNGKIFYLQPGHETYPTYYDRNIRKIIVNAVRWVAPTFRSTDVMDCPNPPKAHRF